MGEYEYTRLERDELVAELAAKCEAIARLRGALRSVRKNIPEGASTAFEIINAALKGEGRG